MKEQWKKLPILAKQIIVAVAIILLIIISRRAMAYLSAKNSIIKDQGAVQAHQSAGETASFTTSQYKAMADKLYWAMKGWGTDEDAVFEVINALKNNVDFLKIRSEFGIRDGYDMKEWFYGDFSSSDIQKINNLLYTKGITYTI